MILEKIKYIVSDSTRFSVWRCAAISIGTSINASTTGSVWGTANVSIYGQTVILKSSLVHPIFHKLQNYDFRKKYY